MPAKIPRRIFLRIMLAGMPLCVAAGFAASRLAGPPVTADNLITVSKPVPGVVDNRRASRAGAVSAAADGGVFQEQREWIERIRATPEGELPALWKEISAISDAYQRRAVLELLYQQWVAADPAGCMEFVTKAESAQRADVMAAWLRRDADGAFAWALAGGDAEKTKDRTRLMFSQLAAIDPAKFLSLAAGVNEEHLPSEAIQAAFRKLAKQNPGAAREALSKLGPKARNNGSWALGREWARTDSKAALAWAKGLTEPVERQSALRGVLASLARTDPEAAIAGLDLLEEVKDAKGEDPKQAIVSGLAGKDPRRAFDFVVSQFSDQGERMRLLAGAVLPKLGAVMKPVELAALLDRTGIVRAGAEGGMSTTVFADGRSFVTDGFDLNLVNYSGGNALPEVADPAAAFREFLGPDMTPAAKFTADQIARQWVTKDAAGAIQTFENTPEGPLRDMLASALLSHASVNGDLSLLAKLESADPARVQDIGEQIINSEVHSDPVKVLEWAGGLSTDGRLQNTAQKAALNAWTAYDPVGALAWADGQPEENQPAFYHAISSARAESDSYVNSEWVASLPEGHNRDSAAAALIENLAAKDPYSALEWIGSIQDIGLRSSSLNNTFADWGQRDATAALQALQTMVLPQEQKNALENNIQSAGKH